MCLKKDFFFFFFFFFFFVAADGQGFFAPSSGVNFEEDFFPPSEKYIPSFLPTQAVVARASRALLPDKVGRGVKIHGKMGKPGPDAKFWVFVKSWGGSKKFFHARYFISRNSSHWGCLSASAASGENFGGTSAREASGKNF